MTKVEKKHDIEANTNSKRFFEISHFDFIVEFKIKKRHPFGIPSLIH